MDDLDLINDESHLEDLEAIQSLKEKLLSIELCINNEYLDKYCELIIANKNTSFIKKQSNKHHIVPKYYYKIKKIQVDNSDNNLVVLSRKNHALAHYYLLKSSFNKRILNYNLYSLKYILSPNIEVEKLQDDIFSEMTKDLNNYHYEFTEEHRKKIGLAGVGNQYNKGKKWTEDMKKDWGPMKGKSHSIETKKKMSEHNYWKGKHLSEEIKEKISKKHKGKHLTLLQKQKIAESSKKWIRTEETRKKMSLSQKGKPKPKLTVECKKKLSLQQKGRIWINNGEITKKIFPQEYEKYNNMGWKKGRI